MFLHHKETSIISQTQECLLLTITFIDYILWLIMDEKIKKALFYILIISAILIWGLNWPSGKIISKYARPEVLAFWRFFGTFLCFIPVAIFGKNSLRLKNDEIIKIVISSVALSLFNLSFFNGLKTGAPGLGGVFFNCFCPVITFLLTLIIFIYCDSQTVYPC